MSEFREKLDNMQESMLNAIPEEDSITINIPEDESQTDNSYPNEILNQRNEKGHRQRQGKGLKNRISSLVADNKAKDIQNQQLLSLVQEQERRLAEAHAKAEQNAFYTNVYYEQSLDNEEQRVLFELKSAKENGEIDKEVELSKRLSDISAQKQTQLLSKTIQKQQEHQNNRDNYYQPQQNYNPPPSSPDVNEDLEDFLDQNPFLDPNSREFDQYLSDEVSQFASHLNKTLKVNKRSDLIGTKEYFDVINGEIKKRYSIEDEHNNDENNNYDSNDDYYVENNKYEVAPVSRKGSSMANRYISNNQNFNPRLHNQRMSLSPQEIEIAKSMVHTLSYYGGKQYTEEECIAEYAKQKMRHPDNKTV